MIKRLIILLSLIFLPTIAYADYTSQYPTQDTDHVKATGSPGTTYYPYMATNPALSVTGPAINNSWLSDPDNASMRFHIDEGSAKVVKRIYLENWHAEGAIQGRGIRTFTFWGSNSATAFADLVYSHDTDWTQIGGEMEANLHVLADQADPQYFVVPNTTAYRYYAIKCYYYTTFWAGFRRIELQTGTAPYTYSHVVLISRLIYRFINLVGLI